MKKQRRGFTLVELLIVIAILGILAAYAVPKYQDLVAQSIKAEAISQLSTVRSALNIYYAKNEGHYPPILDGSIFADGAIPVVTITDTHNHLLSSNNVVNLTSDDFIINPLDVTYLGGWIYKVSSDRTKCDVRINSHSTDRTTGPVWSRKPWYTY